MFSPHFLDWSCRTTTQNTLEETVSSSSVKSYKNEQNWNLRWMNNPACPITTSLYDCNHSPYYPTPMLYMLVSLEMNTIKCNAVISWFSVYVFSYISSFIYAHKFDTAVANYGYPILFSLWLVKQTSVAAVFECLWLLLGSKDFHLTSTILASSGITASVDVLAP